MVQEPPRRDPDAATRAAKALSMRKLGYGYEAIANACDFANRGSAYHAVQRELNRTIQAPADEVRQLELERLDDLYRALMPRALKGDGQLVDKCLSIMTMRARYLGLFAQTADGAAMESIKREYVGVDLEAV